MTLSCFAVFHLNLAFSSIEEEQRAEVLERCYWPLLALARRAPIAIEATGYTLECAAAIDPAWLDALRTLVLSGQTEFIGAGYAQIIGPLVPAEVVRANLRLGTAVYERLLGLRPTIAMVNEQAWSASLAAHYRDADYAAVIMEWDNPSTAHPEWCADWRYAPQVALGQDGASIPVLWNQSIAFQKIQRYAHGELELDEVLEFVRAHRGRGDRVYAVYGSDAEVFDFRPGRYRGEAPVHESGEWRRLDELFAALAREPGVCLVTPSAALARTDPVAGGHALRLETSRKPVPVKKQPKYDLARWAITGHDDLGINTACWRIADALQQGGGDDADWRELCYLSGSDFRTHITARRWAAYVDRLRGAEARMAPRVAVQPAVLSPPPPRAVRVHRRGRFLTLRTEAVDIRLNCRRGLAIDALTFPEVSSLPLCGSMPHGYFEDIDWSADQYTGFLVLAAAGQPQVTDLEAVQPEVTWDAATARVIVRACVATPLGGIEKTLAIGTERPRIDVSYRLRWSEIPLGTLRIGHVTLVPTSFDPRTLFYETHNGGDEMEHFAVTDEVDHIVPVSHLVSCRGGVGATGGVVILGDTQHALRVSIDRSAATLFPLITMRRIGGRFFSRVTLSARELDDTSRLDAQGTSPFVDSLAFAVEPVL